VLLPLAAAAETLQLRPDAEEPVVNLPLVEVIAGSPLPGTGIDRDKVPSNVQSLPAPDTRTQGPKCRPSDVPEAG
jgi:hypothetical protein